MKKPPPLNLDDIPGGPKAGTFIANLDDLADHGGKDILFEEDNLRINILVQRHNGTVHVYENRCPHAGTPLNLFGDRFMNLENTDLICRTHGALFDPNTGKCNKGPCKGQYLRQVDFEEIDGKLYTR